MGKAIKYGVSIILLCLFMSGAVSLMAQQTVLLNDSLKQHIFTYHEIEGLDDVTGRLTFQQILSPAYQAKFNDNRRSTPQGSQPSHAYWYHIRIAGSNASEHAFILEFFDQTIDHIHAFIPDGKGEYKELKLGDQEAFSKRPFPHKNFVIPLPELKGEHNFYFRIQSSQVADVIMVLRSVDFFTGYALGEYFAFGLFYGMILIFCFYNLIMFFAVRQTAYLYYVLYMLCVALFELCTDGIAYQYLWPGWPSWNQFAFGVVLFGMSVSALMFTKKLLYVDRKAAGLARFLNALIVLRSLYFVYCLLFDHRLFNYKFLEAVPLVACFSTGVYIWWKGYRPARYFILGYGILFFGYLIKFLIMLGWEWLNFGVVSYYIMSFCFILEMTFLSLAAGDRLRVLKKRKDKVQARMIRQMQINEELKDGINRHLEHQVKERTQQLTEANKILEQQKSEIARMNVLLEKDNKTLQHNVEQVTHARLMSADVGLEEFMAAYPDQESCFKLIASLKWANGYHCRKCAHVHYYGGHLTHSRRCARCGYEESPTAHTFLQNIRIPVNKAFYLIYLVYTSKGKVSSHQLSAILGIRQSTCWSYASRVQELMQRRKQELRHAGDQGWSKLLVE